MSVIRCMLCLSIMVLVVFGMFIRFRCEVNLFLFMMFLLMRFGFLVKCMISVLKLWV